jgi:GNAT superfamily N-acetyltransferase
VASPPTPAHGVLVALERNSVVGFAAFGPAELAAGEESDPAGPTTELSTLLVEPRWGRRGHGSRLLAAVADVARGGGAARLQVWVPEADGVSAGFYESAGWARDGWARTLDTGGDEPLREIRWHALLGDEDAT